VRALHKQTFGRLTVIELADVNEHRQSMWLCVCRCGQQCVVMHSALTSGNTRSCGCIKEDLLAGREALRRLRAA
jgi:hypothetical protein